MKNKDRIKLEILKLYQTFKTLEKKGSKKEEMNYSESFQEDVSTLIENTVVRLDKILILMKGK